MWCVIARQNVDCSVGDPFQQRIDIMLRPQRRVHLEIRIEVLNRFICQGDVMRTNLSTYFHPPSARLTEESDASSRAHVLAMNLMIAGFGQENIPRYDRFLAG